MFYDEIGCPIIMTLIKPMIFAASALTVCACAPAVQQTADLSQSGISSHNHIENAAQPITSKPVTDGQYRATIKPGANISLKSILPTSMISGSYQTVQLELSEGYRDGVMIVSVEPSDGLELFGGVNSKTFNMSESSPHIWDLDVKADADGVYFLNVFSQADGQGRSFSVRLDIGVGGAISQKMLDDVMPAQGELSEDGKIRVLGADETIQ